MSDDVRRLTTDEQRQWLALAKERGGICAACGRTLDDGEPVFIERLEVELKPLTAPGAVWARKTVNRDAVLGKECASPKFVARTSRLPSEPCEGCGRPVFYAVERAGRSHTFCSRRCASHVRWNVAGGGGVDQGDPEEPYSAPGRSG